MTTMKQARKKFANRSYITKELKDPKSGQPYDVKVRKRSPLGVSFRQWVRANKSMFLGATGKLKELLAA